MPGQAGIVDLSVTLESGVTVYPGDPPVVVEAALRLSAGDGVNVLALHLGSQSGTHVDAPYHVIEDGPRLDELPLARFLGPAVLADLRHVPAEAPISWADLAPVHARLAPGVMLLLHTGWSRHWRDASRYRAHPWLTGQAAEAIVATGMRTVGIDAFSVDATPEDVSTAGFEAHLAILGAGGVIVENLTNLAAVADLADPVLSVLPLNLVRADGAPVRAVAYERSWP
jgi:kynurenine formamidase